MTRTKLLAATSLFAMAAAVPALAQDNTPPAPANSVETVVVSGSRISVAGYTAPTPVTVVDAAQLQRDAQPDIADAIRLLPAFGTSSGPNNSSSANFIVSSTPGIDVVNLRQLGVLRTLVLFDGQRVVASSVSGGVDLSTMPSVLVQRIDVVTGGASAAWGSDAVAGVVNVVLNKNFDGFSANLEGSDSTYDDHRQFKAEAAYGFDFLGDRGHNIVAASYLTSPDTFFINQRDWFKNTRLVNNPAYVAGNGQPKLITVNNVGQSQATQGGLITGCGAALNPGAAFLDHQCRGLGKLLAARRSVRGSQRHAHTVQFRQCLGSLLLGRFGGIGAILSGSSGAAAAHLYLLRSPALPDRRQYRGLGRSELRQVVLGK